MANKVGMPTMGGVKESAIDFVVGAGGGVAFALSQAFLGSGLVGGLAGAAVAGAVIKGVRGTVIATMLGFQSVMGAISGGGNADTDNEVM